eukprot:5582903-Amphidinium_carterae.1
MAHFAVSLGSMAGSRWGGNTSYSLRALVDLTTPRDDRQHWDLTNPVHRKELEQLQKEGELDLLLGSPA